MAPVVQRGTTSPAGNALSTGNNDPIAAPQPSTANGQAPEKLDTAGLISHAIRLEQDNEELLRLAKIGLALIADLADPTTANRFELSSGIKLTEALARVRAISEGALR